MVRATTSACAPRSSPYFSGSAVKDATLIEQSPQRARKRLILRRAMASRAATREARITTAQGASDPLMFRPLTMVSACPEPRTGAW